MRVMKRYLVKYTVVNKFAPIETVVDASDIKEAEEKLIEALKYNDTLLDIKCIREIA